MKHKILSIDDNLAYLKELKKTLERKHFKVDLAEHLADAESLLKSKKYDCITIDLSLGSRSGLEVLKFFTKENKNFKTPLIILSGNITEPVIKKTAKKVSALLTKPVETEKLINTIDIAIENSHKNQKCVAVIDDNEAFAIEIGKYLNDSNFYAVIETNEVRAVELIESVSFDLILLDGVLENNGTRLLLERKSESDCLNSDTPILLMSGHNKITVGKQIVSKVDGFLEKPFEAKELIEKIKSLLSKNDRFVKK